MEESLRGRLTWDGSEYFHFEGDILEAQIITLEGGPGTGKSALLHDLLDGARRRNLPAVLFRCSPQGSEWDASVVEQLSRSLGTSFTWDHGSDHTRENQERALRALLERDHDQSPALLLIDDVQWCDLATQRVLSHLCRRAHDRLPLRIVMAGDPYEAPDRWRLSPAVPIGRAHAVRELGPLSWDTVVERCRHHLGMDSENLVRACVSETGGVPFLVDALLTDLAVTADKVGRVTEADVRACRLRGVADWVWRTTFHYGARLPEALESLSVLRRPLSENLMASALGLPGGDTAEAVKRLSEATFVHRTGEGAMVSPGVVRRAVLARMQPARRQEAELRVATAWVSDGQIQEAAGHLMNTHAGVGESHVTTLQEAALELQGRGAEHNRRARAYLKRALAEPELGARLPEVLTLLGSVEMYVDTNSAVRHLSRAHSMEMPRWLDFECSLRLAHALALSDRPKDAYQVLDRALVPSSNRGQDELRRASAELFFIRLCDGEKPWTPKGYGPPQFKEELGNLATLGRMSRSAWIFSEAFQGRRAIELTRLVRSALSGSSEPGDESALGWLMAASVLIWADKHDLATQVFSRAAEETHKWNLDLSVAVSQWMHGQAALYRGDLDTAEERARSSLELLENRAWGQWRFGPLALLLRIARYRGTLESADSLMAEGLSTEIPRTWVSGLYLAARGQQRASTGVFEEGLADLFEAGRLLTSLGCVNPALCEWRSDAAIVLFHLGRLDEAQRLAHEEVLLARMWGAQRSLAVALRVYGMVRGEEEGLADTDEAVDLVSPGEMPLVAADCLLAQGMVLRANRQNVQSRRPLAEAYRLAWTAGADRLAEQACEELIVAGGRPRQPAPDESKLSPSEERVTKMAADGASNEQIARAHFLSRRTVEAHLTAAYRKLGIRGRAQLPMALEGKHLAPVLSSGKLLAAQED